MSGCAHEDFEASVEVNRLGDGDHGAPDTIAGFTCDLRVHCSKCGEAFTFHGVEVGVDPSKPTMSLDGKELHVPIRPESSDPSFGLGLLGFKMRVDAGAPTGNN